MEIYLISNNLYENNLAYLDKNNLDEKRKTRPLSIEGEEQAKILSLNERFEDANAIYSSSFSSALASSKYLANRLSKNVYVDEGLNDCLIGELSNHNLKMVKFMQDHDFNIKLNNGESLNEVGSRINSVINKIAILNKVNKVVVYTHRRALLGFLAKYCDAGYNLDDELILEYKENVVYSGSEKEIDIIKIVYDNKKIVDISMINI